MIKLRNAGSVSSYVPNNQEKQLKQLKFKDGEKVVVIVVFNTASKKEKGNFFEKVSKKKFFSFSGYSYIVTDEMRS